MTRRALIVLVIGVLVLVAVAQPLARGDVVTNVAPRSQLGSGAELNRYPLDRYGLDVNVEVGITNLGGVPAVIGHSIASQLWSVTKFLVYGAIQLFTWAFSLDLINGRDGALRPVSEAVRNIYGLLGGPFLAVAILCAGFWAIGRALVQRRYSETAGALAASTLFVALALWMVADPQGTIGQASRWTNELSAGLLSVTREGTPGNGQQAKEAAADELFTVLVHEPWLVLNFGGTKHCVDGDNQSVSPHAPGARCIEHDEKYAARWLRYPVASKERKAEYEVLARGKVPSGTDNFVDAVKKVGGGAVTGAVTAPFNPIGAGKGAFGALDDALEGISSKQFDGYQVSAADKPAIEIQQGGGAFERVTISVVVFAGALGVVLLLGFLSLVVIVAQVVALLLFAFAPVALLLGVLPGRGHDFFRGWLAKLAAAIFAKALYSLVLAVLLAVASALLAATGSLGWLLSFGLYTAFFWAVLIYRRQIWARLEAAAVGTRGAYATPPSAPGRRLAGMTTTALMAQRAAGVLRGVHDRGSPAGAGGARKGSLAASVGGGAAPRTLAGDAAQQLRQEFQDRLRRRDEQQVMRDELRELERRPDPAPEQKERADALRYQVIPAAAFSELDDDVRGREARVRAGQEPYTPAERQAKQRQLATRLAGQARGSNGGEPSPTEILGQDLRRFHGHESGGEPPRRAGGSPRDGTSRSAPAAPAGDGPSEARRELDDVDRRLRDARGVGDDERPPARPPEDAP